MFVFELLFFSIFNQKDEERAQRREEKMAEIAARKAEKQVSRTPGVFSKKNRVGVCCALPKTLFKTKTYDFLNPVYDLTKNLI